MPTIKLITLDPGHFHAALVQKEMYPNIASRASVFAPLGMDLADHLGRIARFNGRRENPTSWELEVYGGPDYLERLSTQPPGSVVLLSGKNQIKIDYISKAVQAGMHVLADKPWIIEPAGLNQLEAALDRAEAGGLQAYDIMTERFEVTSLLQRELVNDRDVFGEIVPGSVDNPAVHMESVHHIMKLVAGAPLKRPAWFFDIRQQGEGLSDVGVHLVDLATWILFPDQAIDHRTDVTIHAAKRWPTILSKEDFRQVTGEDRFPDSTLEHVHYGNLEYACNNQVNYSVRGVHVMLDVMWNYEAPAGTGDTHLAVYRGSNARVEVRQGAEESFRPEVYVVPNRRDSLTVTATAVQSRLRALQARHPGVDSEVRGGEILVTIPGELRIGHEAHFAQVARQFFAYLRGDEKMPAWEKPNMLAKYYITTKGVELARS